MEFHAITSYLVIYNAFQLTCQLHFNLVVFINLHQWGFYINLLDSDMDERFHDIYQQEDNEIIAAYKRKCGNTFGL